METPVPTRSLYVDSLPANITSAGISINSAASRGIRSRLFLGHVHLIITFNPFPTPWTAWWPRGHQDLRDYDTTVASVVKVQRPNPSTNRLQVEPRGRAKPKDPG